MFADHGAAFPYRGDDMVLLEQRSSQFRTWCHYALTNRTQAIALDCAKARMDRLRSTS